MDEREQVVQLLLWIKSKGLWPERIKGDELFVVLVVNKLMRWRDLKPHQKQNALWVPSPRSLKKVLAERGFGELKMRQMDGVHFVSFEAKETVRGAGVGIPEALLSSLNALRKKGYLSVN